MDKRYQVFVSSTYADLKDERQKVIQTLMQLDCMPAGMELFPAADMEQFAFIKKVIDDCDYYIIIVGGRYGSVTAEGVSYTELEFDYAVSKGMKVIAFLHSDPDSIPVGKSDIDPVARQRLHDFCEKVKTDRLVNFWSSATELPGLVALNLPRTIKMFPAVGWVRASTVASTELLGDMNALRKENDTLRKRIVAPKLDVGDIQLAGLDEVFVIKGTCSYSGNRTTSWSQALSWRKMFAIVAPLMENYTNGATVKNELTKAAFALTGWRDAGGFNPLMDGQVFLTITVQFKALSLVRVDHLKTTQGGMADFWKLTSAGSQMMLEERVVRTAITDEPLSDSVDTDQTE